MSSHTSAGTGAPGVFVGRDAEVATLVAAVDDACGGTGSLVVVTGEAGIGKSRLAGRVAAFARQRGLATGWGFASPAVPVPMGPWREALDELGQPLDDAGVGGRPQLFELVHERISGVAARQPALIVLEDLHWADETTLLQLAWLRPRLARLPVVVLATSRVELASAGRPDRHIALGGLSETEVRALVSAMGDGERDAAEIRRRTGGNPFFVLAVASAPGGRAPASATDLLLERVAALDPAVRELLDAAAVLGGSVDPALLAAVVGRAVGVEELDPAVEAGLLLDDEDRSASFRFRHDLVREAVYGRIERATRRRLHAAAADALAARPGCVPAAVAAHLLAAGDPERTPDLAVWAERAAQRAADGAAHEEAARWFDRARLARADDDPRRLDLQLAAADRWGRAGARERAWAAYEEVAAEAGRLDDPARLAEAALGFGGGRVGFEVPPFHERQRTLLEQALARLGDDHAALRSLVQSRLSIALSFAGDQRRQRTLAEDALASARLAADPGALVTALSSWCDAHAGPDRVDARLAAAAEMVEAARGAGEDELELLGLRFRIVALLERGACLDADREVARFADIAGRLRQPGIAFYVPLFRAMRALTHGRLDEAERRLVEAEELGRRADSENAMMLTGTQLFQLRLLQGRAAEVEEFVRSFVERYPDVSGPHAGLALIEAHTGRLDSARARLDAMYATGFAGFPFDGEWLASMTTLAELAVRTHHLAAAEDLVDRLRPYGHLFAVDGIGAVLLAPVSLLLARLRLVLGRNREAEEDLAQAIDAARAADAPFLVEQALSCRSAAPSAPATPSPPCPTARFVREGDVWVLGWNGDERRLRHSKGLGYLAALLRRPHAEIHAADLAGAGTIEGDVGPALDARARAAYRARIVELQQDLDDAEADADLGRAATARAELDALLAELAGAVGLGGRDRRRGSVSERARVNVTKSIKQAIERIEVHSPSMAHHLRTTIRTGTFCAYEPDPVSPPRWELERAGGDAVT